MTTFAERLLVDSDTRYDFSNQDWIRFLKDHREYILGSVTVLEIDPNVANTFRFHMTELLREHQLNTKDSWIIMWLNQIKGDWEVVNLEYLLVPQDDTIDELWDKYKSFRQKQEEAS